MSEQLIYSAIPAIISAVGPVGKNATNQQQGYKYRSADDICDALHDSLGKFGVFSTCEIKDREVTERQTKSGGTLLYVVLNCRFSFHAKDGSHVCTESVGEAMDSGDKATNKAMTAAYKYALLQTFCLMGHEDSEVQTHEVVQEKITRNARGWAKNDIPAAESPKPGVSKYAQTQVAIKSFVGTPEQWKAFMTRCCNGVHQLAAAGELTAGETQELKQMLQDRVPEFILKESPVEALLADAKKPQPAEHPF